MTDSLPRTWVPDLFGEPSRPRSGGRGRRCHVPSRSLQDRVRSLRAGGLSIDAIAMVTGLSRSTLFRHYAVELGSRSTAWLDVVGTGNATGFEKLSRGRPRHEPTSALRELVRGLAIEGCSLSAISQATGLAPQTVRRHYGAELEGRAG